MKKLILTLVLMSCIGRAWAVDVPNLSAENALKKLKQGNERFVNSHMKHPNESKSRRQQLLKSQHPFVTILSCSDSRVPTEMIFDEGLGDIFVIRNAGNVLDEHILGSIEYAVEHLGVNLVVVMGHESCGAVGAALSDNKETKAIESIKKAIEPAVAMSKKEGNFSYENVVKTNARLGVENILKDKDLRDYMKKHDVKIIPAYYNLETGKVDFL